MDTFTYSESINCMSISLGQLDINKYFVSQIIMTKSNSFEAFAVPTLDLLGSELLVQIRENSNHI